MSTPHSVRVLPKGANAPRSKVHTQFNNLIKKLDAERKLLAEWHDVVPRFKARLDTEFEPLDQRYLERTKDMILLLDDAWENKKLTKTEYVLLSELICQMIEELLDMGKGDALEEIYAKHGGRGDEDFREDDPDAEDLDESLTQLLDEIGLGVAPEMRGDHGEPQAPPKVGAREARRLADEAKLQHSVRDVFRKLASSLHPDRETDPVERERKNALMQRANVAYADNDLLALLELQFEIAQIDAAGLEALGDDRIKQYIKTLKRQLADAEMEIDVLQEVMLGTLSTRGTRRIKPAQLEEFLDAKIQELQEDLAGIEQDLVDFLDKKKLKAFLKNARLDMYEDPDLFW